MLADCHGPTLWHSTTKCALLEASINKVQKPQTIEFIFHVTVHYCNEMHASPTGSSTPIMSEPNNYILLMSDGWYLQSKDVFLPQSWQPDWHLHIIIIPTSQRGTVSPQWMRALHNHSSHISKSNDHSIFTSSDWVHEEDLTESEPELTSWLLILYRHRAGKAVDVMTYFSPRGGNERRHWDIHMETHAEASRQWRQQDWQWIAADS